MQEHLLRQLQLEPIDTELRVICETLIQNLNDDGFHKEKPETLFSSVIDCKAQSRMNEALALVRGLDPVGCCTNDYRESLMVQIEISNSAMRRRRTDASKPARDNAEISLIEKVLDNLELLEREKYAALAKKLNINEKDTRALCDILKKLSPFPGRAFASQADEVRYVVPDIKVLRDGGEFTINLNDEAFPVLGINSNFEKFTSSSDKAARSFAKENIREARLFINHLSQRSQTLIRVASAILEFQRSFFINGPKFLAPLTLGDIARELNIHETTVSRTANGKYMQTEWGIFEIRYFFTNSITGAGSTGSQYSKKSVKEMIKEIIEEENRLLSDLDISAMLSQKGIALARRTVAKYRKELDMGSSYTRRVQDSKKSREVQNEFGH